MFSFVLPFKRRFGALRFHPTFREIFGILAVLLLLLIFGFSAKFIMGVVEPPKKVGIMAEIKCIDGRMFIVHTDGSKIEFLDSRGNPRVCSSMI